MSEKMVGPGGTCIDCLKKYGADMTKWEPPLPHEYERYTLICAVCERPETADQTWGTKSGQYDREFDETIENIMAAKAAAKENTDE